MYCDAFGLKIPPFNNTPDPRFFFNTPEHEEALASLLYAVDQRKGFVLVTGDVGSGKTLLSRILLNRLSSSVKTAVITNTNLTGPELLRAICREFEIDTEDANTSAELCGALEQFLLEQYSRDRLAVVVLDEAQNLPFEAMEQLRMLGNLEADDAKLLQVLILGQPELQETFRQPSMRQIYQRIFRTFHLRALTQELTAAYILHRLAIGGLPAGRRLFEPAAVTEVFRHSQGVPRVINQICDNALLAAYAESSEIVTSRLVKEVVEQMMSLEEPRPQQSREVDSSLERRLDVVDRMLRQMSERMEKTESLADSGLTRRTVSARQSEDLITTLSEKLRSSEDRIETLTTRVAEMEEKRRLHEQGLPRGAQDEIAPLMGLKTRAQQFLSRAEQLLRADDGIDGESRKNAALRSEIKHLVGELKFLNENHEQDIQQLREKAEDEFAVARQARHEAEAILSELRRAQAASNAALGDANAKTEELAKAIREQGAQFVEHTALQVAELHGQLSHFVYDAQAKGEAAQSRASEMLAQQRTDVEATRRLVDEFQETFKTRAGKMTAACEQTLADTKSQTKTLLDSLHEMRNRVETRASQVQSNIDQMEEGASHRMEEAERKIASVLLRAENEVATACRSLNTTRDKVTSDADRDRAHAKNLLEQTQNLLTQTRDQCASLLSSLRTQVSDQKDKIERTWQAAFNDGVKTLNDLQARLAETRMLSDRSRSELENIVQNAVVEVGKSKETFDSALNGHRKEVTKLSLEAYAIKADVAKRFEEARKGLDGLISKHEDGTQHKLNEFSANMQSRISVAESMASGRVTELQKELGIASERADQICKDLREFIDTMRRSAADAHAQYSQEADKAQHELIRMFEKNTTLLDHAKGQVDSLSQKAREITEGMESKISDAKETAQADINTMAQELAGIVANAISQAKQLRQESEEFSRQFAEHMSRTNDDASKATADADRTIGLIRRQSRESLLEVRACMTQMSERSDLLRRELSQMSEEVHNSANIAMERLDQTGHRLIDQVETLRHTAQLEAEGYTKRLGSLRLQVEQSAEQMRQNTTKLLDQVQAGSTGLRQHAEELLTQAQGGAVKINESAAAILMQAQTAAERFREQAQTILNRAEATASTVQTAVTDLKTKLALESEDTREQMAAVKQELSGARTASAEMLQQASEAHREAQKKTDELLDQAKSLRYEAEAMLSMPKELVEEAKQQASSLSGMSKKISAVVQQLATAGNAAHQHRTAIEQANADADEKVDLLRRHTERVGQLVGIIRQLYGTMDARIERLRGRLIQADDLMRSVPQDIENLRSLLHETPQMDEPDFGNGSGGVAAPPAPARTKVKSAANRISAPARQTVSRTTGPDLEPAPKLASAPVITPAAAATEKPAAKPVTKATLGEVVQRNQKLNEWLKQMLGEEALAGKIAELQSERFPPTQQKKGEPADGNGEA